MSAHDLKNPPSSATPPRVATPGDAASDTESRPPAFVSVTPAAAPSCYLSIVVPAYNEENRLPATLARLDEYLTARDLTFELIVVDDGSHDSTREVVRDFMDGRPWARLAQYDDEHGKPVNRGKGFAVRQGVLAAVGRDILFSDADLSTPIEEMEKLLPPIACGEYDITIASRALPESNLAVHQPWYREWMGRQFNAIVKRVIETQIHDTQCGFKAFRGQAAKRIFATAQVDGFGFDPEIIYLARKFGYRVKEVPVTWRHRDDSRVSPLIAPLQMLNEVIQIRFNEIRGIYDRADPGDTA